MNNIVVLITACGNVYMPGITKCIKENGERNIRLVGADMNKDDTILEMMDAYYQVPKASDDSYIDSLVEVCEKEKVDILIPIMSAELEKLALNRDKFEAVGTKVAVSELESLRIANDKLKLFNFLKDNDLNCPNYCEVNNINDVDAATKKIGTPIVFKATEGSGSRGMRIIDPTKSEFEILFNEKPSSAYTTIENFKNTLSMGNMPPMLAMEYLPGDEYTVDILANNGEIKYSLCRKGLNVQAGIILGGIVEDNPNVTEICNKVVSKLKLTGNIGFDVKLRTDGTPVIMECNPRVTAGIAEFNASGVNLLYFCIKQLLNEEVPEVDVTYGIKMTRRYMEMYTK